MIWLIAQRVREGRRRRREKRESIVSEFGIWIGINLIIKYMKGRGGSIYY